MKTIGRLDRWRDAGLITGRQHDTLRMLLLKERFSVFLELNATLYLGVLSLVGGLAWTAQTYGDRLGDLFILSALSILFGICLYYCFSRAHPFSAGEVESPNLVFDYVLYLGCLTLGIELGYIENRFQLLGTAWDHYLLFSAGVCFFFAYRFDNRLVLSLAISSLGGWFGLRFSRFGFLTGDSMRMQALIYSVLVAGGGTLLWHRALKRHFVETYLHVAINVGLIALLTGIGWTSAGWTYLILLLVLCAIAGGLGFKYARFPFVAYAIAYAYIGISYLVLSDTRDLQAALLYLALTGALVVIAIVKLAQRLAKPK